MGQQKAKWQFDPGAGWSAECGPFHLHANNAGDGRAELYDSEWMGLWEHQLAEPYDIVDLMLLAEAELERRLRAAAETMSGEELVAEQERTCVGFDMGHDEGTVWVVHESNGDVKPLKFVPTQHAAGRDCSACEACGTHCLPIGSLVDGRCKCCGPVKTDPYETALDQGLIAAKAPDASRWLLSELFKLVKTPVFTEVDFTHEYTCKECGVKNLTEFRDVDLCPACRDVDQPPIYEVELAMQDALGYGQDMNNAANVTPAEAITNAAFVIVDLHGAEVVNLGAAGVSKLVQLFANSLTDLVNMPK